MFTFGPSTAADTHPSAYIQAGLHAAEAPGIIAALKLLPLLEQAEKQGHVRGRITLVPQVNPIGSGQALMHEPMGRFSLSSGCNFNRNFPLSQTPLPEVDINHQDGVSSATAETRLKRFLTGCAHQHNYVLDLHCDEESVRYLYIPRTFWPAMMSLAACLEVEAVILWDGDGGGAFEHAAAYPAMSAGVSGADKVAGMPIAVTTVELGGLTDVSEERARADAEGLMAYLVCSGIVDPAALEHVLSSNKWDGRVADIETVDVIHASIGGIITYDCQPGDVIAFGDSHAFTIHGAPGEPPQTHLLDKGDYVLTRRGTRTVSRGDVVMKVFAANPKANGDRGPLEP